MHSYKTLAGRAEATIIEKKSEFIAHASPATTEEEALAFLEEIRTRHRTANHNVYAYSLRHEARQRYSDDGEPAKTAGLPVLGIITHADIVDCIIVVTRYFGGTLLGTGGLVRAYSGAAQAVLENSEILTVQQCLTLAITIDYPLFEQARRIFEDAGAKLQEPEYTDKVLVTGTMPVGTEELIVPKLNELCRGNAQITISEPFYIPF